MNYVNAKNAAEIKLNGISITFEKVENSLKAVYLRDDEGGFCRIALDAYTLCAQVPAPPKMEDRYILRGDVPVIGPIERQYGSQFEADQAKRDLANQFSNDISLTVTKEKVQVDPAAPAPVPF